jgi:hypothetical protein
VKKYSAVIIPRADEPLSKEEEFLGYSYEQQKQAKALHRLGATEEEVLNAHAHKISQLGQQAHHVMSNSARK